MLRDPVRSVFADGTVWLDRFDATLTPITWQKDTNVEVTPTTIRKVSGVAAWDSQAYSDQFLTGGCYLEFKASQNNKSFIFGINTDPAASSHYNSIDFGFWCVANANLNFLEIGTPSAGGGAVYNADTILGIQYNNADIIYYVDKVEVRRTVGVGAGLVFAVDSSLYDAGAEINSIKFSKPQAISAHTAEVGVGYTGNATIVGDKVINQSGAVESIVFDVGLKSKVVNIACSILTTSYDIIFRNVDVNNKWYYTRTTADITLFEVKLGVTTNKGTLALAFSADEKASLLDDGTNISMTINNTKAPSSSLAFNGLQTDITIETLGINTSLDSVEVMAL